MFIKTKCESSFCNPCLKAHFSNQVYNELAEKIYSLVIQKRQYGFYVNNLKLYSIPTSLSPFDFTGPKEEIQNLDADKVYDIRYYNELVNSIPSEYVSPSIILYCMVEQVTIA